jgi:uncharacterized protein (UPF0332 family)
MKPLFETAFNKAVDSYESAALLFTHQRYTAAINRCYYAIYHIVSALVDDSQSKHIKTHKGLIRIFSEEFIKSKKLPLSLLVTLKAAFEKRQFADYDIESDFTENEVNDLLLSTKSFLEEIKPFLHQF